MILKDKSKPVLVTGANGYIGSWITKELLDNNYTVHATVRDISNIGSIPNIYVIEPSCAEELDQILDWGINKSERSIYIRLNSLATEINFKFPTKNV